MQVGSQKSGVEEKNTASSTCQPHWFWSSLGYNCLSEVQLRRAGSCLASHQPTPSSSSPQGCFQFILLQPCTCAWDGPDSGTGSCVWPCWTSWDLHRPTYQACWDSSGWHPFPPACWLNPAALCCQQACSGCIRSLCPCFQWRCRTALVPTPIPEKHNVFNFTTNHIFSSNYQGRIWNQFLFLF